jgi:hypothetical protein
MIDKKQLIEELLECVKDATDTETQITGLSMCAMLMNEVLDEALTLPDVIDTLVCDCEIPKPKSPFIGDYEYDYCRDCDGHISQTNYL